MKHLTLSPDVLASVPITDIRHTIREIDKHRHVHTMIAESNRKRSQYYQSHNK